jgi:hypothetical protein
MIIKKIAETLLPKPIYHQIKMTVANPLVLRHWELNGRTIPPPHILKQTVIQAYQQRFMLDTLVETGTYQGAMIEAQRRFFKKIISVELDPDLCQAARKKFEKYSHIKILEGDSGEVVPTLVPTLDKAVLFWLDGHYSSGITAKGEKECPIYEELSPILKSKYWHVILIDDARHFVGQNDYPTLEKLEKFVKKINTGYQMEVKDDLIRLTPPTQ